MSQFRMAGWLLIPVLLAGCATTTVKHGEPAAEKEGFSLLGYQLGSPQRYDAVKKIHIPRVANLEEIREPHLDMEATDIIINEFTKEQTYEVVPRQEQADAVLKVTLTKIDMGAVRYIDRDQNKTERGVPNEYRINVFADVQMLNAANSNLIWKVSGIRGMYDFIAPDNFQEGKREALLHSCGDLARRILEAAVERW